MREKTLKEIMELTKSKDPHVKDAADLARKLLNDNRIKKWAND